MSYPSQIRHNHHAKIFMNNTILRLTNKFNIKKNISTVLDDPNFQSSHTLHQFKFVIITQNNQEDYLEMQNNCPLNVTLYNNEYGDIEDIRVNKKICTIDVDHADFCQCWDSVKYDIFSRLQSDMYSNKSILRLTVANRGTTNSHGKRKGMTIEKTIEKIQQDLQNVTSNYHIKILPLRDWCIPKKDRPLFSKNYSESIAYTYANMINIICILTKKSL